MKLITEAWKLKHKRVLVRVDWSVPTADGVVLNDYQLKKTFPTIEYLQKAGAKVILISHAERDTDSLKPIFEHVKNFLPLTFIVGVYGMNFDTFPELHWRWAYPALWVAMIALTTVMLYIFKKKRWI